MVQFTKIAIGDEDGVKKINDNFDMTQQTLNLEDKKTVEVPLEGDWRNIGANRLVLTITPYGANLRGYIADKDSWLIGGSGTATAGYGNNGGAIAQLPQSVSFRGKTYKFSIGIPQLCALGGAGGDSQVNGIRILDSGNGLVYVYEKKDLVGGNSISINCSVDMHEA
ncbi:hypothetical protein [Ligilactobacillus saerimneri]|uniref:hypothetical protein n=1 Tax=Ligilactobacillus saerimneri TaxID=228229 RepID=UPI001C114E71|nr:hypothetical protein [Ligilactobacillus saerimneri]MBU5309225.1 hypothetical protein [Ligilactobacillus saerimneri]